MAKIKAIKAREILDSRGNPTIETSIWADTGHGATASIPSGASTGRFEAVELRDNDPKRFSGMGVLKVVNIVNEVISPYIIGRDPSHQNEIDQILLNLDGTANKSRLGANAILSVSQAVLELGAMVNSLQTFEYISLKYGLHQPTANNMPTPILNLVNGGKHGAGNLDFQEFHLIPSTQKDFATALEIGDTVYQSMKKILIAKNAIHSVGDEGGFAPNLFSNSDALELLIESIRDTSYQLNQDVFVGLDVAATSFYKGSKYQIKDRKDAFTAAEFTDFLINLKTRFNLISIEDPFEQEAWTDWANITSKIGQDTMIVGDDLLVTNLNRLEKAIASQTCNAILVKPNQIGTISQAVSVVKLAKENNFTVIASHRSGDTDEDFIADFAVGVGADFAKFGAPTRGERVAKYNRLLYILDYLKQS
ncbi:phosphopyruvate hydratase [Candidatus Collierbacteria bacterium]|nr:phosphopyruvate hydratase [Candidatus Collierbacteria bacterium]